MGRPIGPKKGHRYSVDFRLMALTLLLVCGFLSSLLYIAMNVFVPMRFESYGLASQRPARARRPLTAARARRLGSDKSLYVAYAPAAWTGGCKARPAVSAKPGAFNVLGLAARTFHAGASQRAGRVRWPEGSAAAWAGQEWSKVRLGCDLELEFKRAVCRQVVASPRNRQKEKGLGNTSLAPSCAAQDSLALIFLTSSG